MPHPPDVLVQVAGRHQRQDRTLGGATCPLAHSRRRASQPGYQVGLGHQPADPELRREDLGGGPQVHHDVLVQAEQGGQGRHVVAELTVVVVFDDECAGRTCPSDQRVPARNSQPAAERVLVGRRGVDQPEPGRECVHHQAVGVHRARDHARPMGGEHRTGSRVAGLLHAHLVARTQQGRRDQPETAGHAAGDQDLLRQAAEPPAPPQVAGEGGTESGVTLRLGRRQGRTGASASPCPPPGRAVDPRGPGDAGPQLDHRRPWDGVAFRWPPRAPGSAASGARRAISQPAGRAGRTFGHVSPRAGPSFDPPFREQLGVGAGYDRPADPECGGQRPGGRQSLTRGQRPIGHRSPQLAHDLDGERPRIGPARCQREFHADTVQSGLPFYLLSGYSHQTTFWVA